MADGSAATIELRPQEGPQEAFLSSPADIVIYGGSAGGGKMLRVDERIPTPAGWTTMGALRQGDLVFGKDGQPVKVLAAHPVAMPEKCYLLTFDDGSKIEACSEHQWLTFDAKELLRLTKSDPEWRARRRANRPSRAGSKKSEAFRLSISARNSATAVSVVPTGSVRTTAQIVETLRTRTGRANHAMPVADPLQLSDAQLPMDPYLLGVWLGDGTTTNAGITSADPEIFQAFQDQGWELGLVQQKEGAKCQTRNVIGMIQTLRDAGVLGNKHVPAAYMRASEAQRLALLQGLMDTDGTCCKSGSVEFTSTKKELAEGVRQLALSLGCKASTREGRSKLNGRDCGPKYTVKWTTTLPVFRLARKQARQKTETRRTTKFRYVVDAVECAPSPMRCITVADPSGLYLAGESMLVTHNTYALLMEPLRHINNPGFGAVIFRRESTQITNEGGLWDTAATIYPPLGGQPRVTPKMLYRWPSGAKVGFGHLNAELSVLDWQGAQIPLICFDELTHFSKNQFYYMLSRNRSACGVRPYVRATTNPDADSWVAEFIAWWIDQDSGLPIPERAGILRWFVRVDDTVHWADSAEELAERFEIPATDAKSLTFIPALVTDNQALLRADPGYLANLKALGRVERERLLGGNWKVRPAAGMYFRRSEVEIIDSLPLEPELAYWARGWDLAATIPTDSNTSPDWTVGIKMARMRDGRVLIADVQRFRKRAGEVRETVKTTAEQDGKHVRIRLPQDPGQAGKDQAETYLRELSGWPLRVQRVTGDKVTRAEPVSAAWQQGQVLMLRAPWNDALLSELEAFPEGAHDDQVDALADAFDELPKAGAGRFAVIQTTEVDY